MRLSSAILVALGSTLAIGATQVAPLPIDAGREFYPADALGQGLQGDVPVKISVSATGELRCSVPPGGALAPLKRPSCALLAERGLFPPRVQNGVAIPSEYSFVVHWNPKTDNSQFGGAIPIGRPLWVTYADYPRLARRQMLTGKVSVAFEINEYGRAENCSVKRSNTTKTLAGAVCPLIIDRAMFLPAVGADGRPKRTTGSFNTEWEWCEESNLQRCQQPDTGH